MCVVRSRELNYVDYYVMVFRNVCFELEFVIRDVILVKNRAGLDEPGGAAPGTSPANATGTCIIQP